MKKTLFSLLASLTLLVASCNNDPYEVHQSFFFPQKPEGMITYADQTMDTIRLYSLDTWTASTSQSWCSVSPDKYQIRNDSLVLNTLMTITNEVNTSGARRVGYIQVKTFTDLGMRVVQNAWLNISRPEPMYSTTPEDNMDNLPANKVYFLLNAQAKTDTAIVFTVYQDNATLSSSETWAVPETTTFSAGRHNVRISLEPNPTTSSRTATLTLTSAGVNTPISIIQSAKE